MSQANEDYVRSRACRAGPDAVCCIGDETTLTHHTFANGQFIDAPRPDEEVEVSLLTGKLTVEEASRYRRPRGVTPRALARAAVRYTTAGTLRIAGFAVVHTCGSISRGCTATREHVSVVWPTDDPLKRQDTPWPPDVSKRFVQCFNEDGGEV